LCAHTFIATNAYHFHPIQECTVLFADIAGFTAWSSTREPSQVFMLLETVYHEFDTIAKRRRVFKVETVGDCYVAVAGLPEPRRDHAVVMARFARDCISCMNVLTKKLEVQLGPDTTDLAMRFGLHSGPVTAGVLRGERARFQLFGDTVNTASRMESTGRCNSIQISQETADLLIGAGKQHWVIPRKDKVHAKGKGELQTFWLMTVHEYATSHVTSTSEGSSSHDIGAHDVLQEMPLSRSNSISNMHESQTASVFVEAKLQRLVDWNTALLLRHIKSIITQRRNLGTVPDECDKIRKLETSRPRLGETVLNEVVEIVELPCFDKRACLNAEEAEKVILGEELEIQTRNYVQTIAAMYRDNPFHNFEHASHVTMSSVKLLSRIVAPDLGKVSGDAALQSLHDHTYGITSDPLTQFAVIFSALIHDVDHTGVPNATLVREKARVASVYKNKSAAEQNSVDIAWELLMDDSYALVRKQIYQTECEYRRFRQLVINSVLATDIMDQDLGMLRKARWNRAFADDTVHHENAGQLVNRKATIVIEHLIQASDVAHTMQHWHIYTKWNERLFEEMYVAYHNGRSDKNPADNWYQGEIGFYDFYIIPLAMKLRSCGVFGVSSDEYLSYAQQNRREWELKGKDYVAKMHEKYQQKYQVV
jgi:class 3 adenylate cyclase